MAKPKIQIVYSYDASFSFGATNDGFDHFNRKARSREIIVERTTGISNRELIEATEFELQEIDFGIDNPLTKSILRRTIGRITTVVGTRRRTAVFGQFKEVELRKFRTVFDLVNGNITNEQIIFGSETTVGTDRILIPSTVDSVVETQTCVLGICGQ